MVATTSKYTLILNILYNWSREVSIESSTVHNLSSRVCYGSSSCYSYSSTCCKLFKTSISGNATRNGDNITYGRSCSRVVSQDICTAIIGQKATSVIGCNCPSVLNLVSTCTDCENIGDSYRHNIYGRNILCQLDIACILWHKLDCAIILTCNTTDRAHLLRDYFALERGISTDTNYKCLSIGSHKVNIFGTCCRVPYIAGNATCRINIAQLYILRLVVKNIAQSDINRLNSC